MNGYEAYKIYVSLKAHFGGDKYDFFRFGKLSPKIETFENRKDRHFFDKLAKRHANEESMVRFLVSQMHDNPSLWIGSMMGEEANQRFLVWRKRNERLSYQFGEDIKTLIHYASIHEDFTPQSWVKLFVCDGKNHPKIFKLLLQKRITPETFCLLDYLTEFTNTWDSKLKTDPVWTEYRKTIRGYRPFVVHAANLQNIKESVKKILCEST
jgi:hypothetical protein